MPETDSQRPPPGEAYLRELEDHLLAEFSERNARIQRLRRLRHMETPVDIPPAYRSTTPGGAYAPGARATQARDRQPHGQPAPGACAAGRADRGPRAPAPTCGRAGPTPPLRRMDSEAGRDVFGMLLDALVADGAGVLKLLYAPDRWAGYPRRSAHADESAGRLPAPCGALQEIGPAFRWPGGTWTSPPSTRWKAKTDWRPAWRSPNARAAWCSGATD